MNKMKNKTLKTILRWIAVLPAAVLAGACVFLLLTLLTVFHEVSIISTIWESIANGEFTLMVKPDSELSEFNVIGTVFITLNFICPAAASAAFVYAGAYTAPSGRKAVATVLATIKCMLPIIGITLAIISSTVDEYKWYEWLNIVAIVVGAIAAAIYIYGKEES